MFSNNSVNDRTISLEYNYSNRADFPNLISLSVVVADCVLNFYTYSFVCPYVCAIDVADGLSIKLYERKIKREASKLSLVVYILATDKMLALRICQEVQFLLQSIWTSYSQ